MTWDVDFYQAVMGNSDFSSNITTLSKEYYSDAVAPFAIYQFIANEGSPDLSNADQQGNYLIQTNIWASSPTECETLARYAISGINTLDASRITQRSLGRDDDQELFGLAIDCEIWFESP
jgi:hypothetical protein